MLQNKKNLGSQEKANPKDLFKVAIENKDGDQLYDLIELNLKISIPRVAVSGHDAPFDFVRDYLFDEFNSAVVLANRSGGKTMNFGILDTIMAYISPLTEIATVGAIQAQAKKCYNYFREFSKLHPFKNNIESFTMNETKCRNKSLVQILIGTMAGVNSPHPQLVFLDEIDLMTWPILQQAFSMAQSKHGVMSKMVLTSTRKFAGGAMQRMIEEAEERGLRKYEWNIWDVVASLPKDNPELMKEIEKTFGNSLPKNIDKANGYYLWQDLIEKYKSLDQEVWETEWLCSRPGLSGVVYGSAYSDDENLIEDWSPKGEPGFIYLLEDF